MSTANAAETYIRRQTVWAALQSIFKADRPDNERLERIATVAEVAIDQVFQGLQVPVEDQDHTYQNVQSYATASALYGYSLGRADALRSLSGH